MSPIRVLIVDDHEMVGDALAVALRRHDDVAIVGIARTGREGVALIRETSPDVVLLDYQLPDVDGVTVARMIKQQAPTTKVVLLSGVLTEQIALEAVEAGCSGFLTKTRGVTELVGAVRAAHAGESLLDPSLLAHILPRLRREPRARAVDLTAREREVLALMAEGMTNETLAARLELSPHTVRKHVQNILDKLGAHSKLEAVAIAAREGLVRYG